MTRFLLVFAAVTVLHAVSATVQPSCALGESNRDIRERVIRAHEFASAVDSLPQVLIHMNVESCSFKLEDSSTEPLDNLMRAIEETDSASERLEFRQILAWSKSRYYLERNSLQMCPDDHPLAGRRLMTGYWGTSTHATQYSQFKDKVRNHTVFADARSVRSGGHPFYLSLIHI